MAQARQYPEVGQIVDQIESQLGNAPINPEELTQAIKALEHVLQVPEDYPKIRAAAIMEDMIDPDMLPAQFDIRIVLAILIALYELQDRFMMRRGAQPPPMQGNLSPAAMQLAAAGRGGDSELVHVNPREKEMLERVGGQGSINPNTGLREYKGGFFKSLLKIAVPVASIFLTPVVAGALGSIGMGTTAANIVGSAALGAAGSAATGGNVLQGAALGGLGGGLGSVVGKTANEALGLGLGTKTANVLGSGLVGAGVGAATGQGALKGAASGVMGGALGQLAQGAVGNAADPLSKGLVSGAQSAGNALTAGYSPTQAGAAGLMSGLYGGLTSKPSTEALDSLTKLNSGETPALDYGSNVTTDKFGVRGLDYSGAYPQDSLSNILQTSTPSTAVKGLDYNGIEVPTAAEVPTVGSQPSAASQPTPSAPPAAPASKGILGTGVSTSGLLGLGTIGYSLLSGSEVPTETMPELSEDQKEYMNLPTLTWDWSQLEKDAAASGQSLGAYVSNNWNTVQGGKYNVAAAAKGGALSQIAGYARGAGTGRSDSIDAKLSDGEYVIDAETVSLLGDGSNEAGARMLDQMRKQIRKQKGKALSKGKISPDAKSPLAYIKEMV